MTNLPENVINKIMCFMSSPTAKLITYAVDDTVLFYLKSEKYQDIFEAGMDSVMEFEECMEGLGKLSVRRNGITKHQLLAYLSGYLVQLEGGSDDGSPLPESQEIFVNAMIVEVRELLENIIFLKF